MTVHLRAMIGGLVVGLVVLGSAFAAIVVKPGAEAARIPGGDAFKRAAEQVGGPSSETELSPQEVVAVAKSDVKAPQGGRLPAGRFLVGASRASLHPAPTRFGGERWMTEDCTSIEEQNVNADHVLPQIDPADPVTSLDDVRSWPATPPDCIYLGGFGIGPHRAAKSVGSGGVWIRAVAISNGVDTFVYAIADTVGWFARYDSTICTDCGIRDVRDRLAGDLGVDVDNLVVGSTHTHAGADTYGGWGGIPHWYRDQIRDSAIAAVKQAVINMEPATIAAGVTHLRDRNNERRDTYYSNVDTAAPWLQAKTRSGRVIATFGAFAAHPTIVGGPFLHADWPGAASRRFESRYGGVGMMFEGGLGNASVSGVGGASEELEAEATGRAIADDIARSVSGDGVVLSSNDMKASVEDLTHPVSTNPGVMTLAAVGFFDREFVPPSAGADVPGAYHWSKSDEPPGSLRGCDSAGPALRTTVGAHRIGNVLIAFTPGEIFSNIAEVIEERADKNSIAMVLGQSNDALGYIIQSFEFDAMGNAVTEYGTMTGEYEEVFAVDRCFGDHVLESVLASTGALGFGS